MLTRRQPFSPQPSPKIAGFVYVALGFMGMVMGGFFWLLRDRIGADTNVLTVICSALVAYGAFRIITGVIAIRKAAKEAGPFTLHGKTPVLTDTKPEERP